MVEGGKHDPVGKTERAHEIEHLLLKAAVFKNRRLQFDDIQKVMLLDERKILLQRRNALNRALPAELIRKIKRAQFFQRQVLNQQVAAGDAQQAFVVKNDRHAVGRELDIELRAVRS